MLKGEELGYMLRFVVMEHQVCILFMQSHMHMLDYSVISFLNCVSAFRLTCLTNMFR